MHHALLRAAGCAALVLSSPAAFAHQEPAPAAAASAPAPHWSYAGANGPAHWGMSDPHNLTCGIGRRQSPIDLSSHAAKAGKASALHIDYAPDTVALSNNGHTVQADLASTAHGVSLEGHRYTLAQFHFHAPSEHTIDGESYPLEIHFVNKDSAGQLAVVGVLVREGAPNPVLAPVFDGLPATPTSADRHAGKPVAVDLAALLPKHPEAYLYPGSLTTPPCTEGVRWIVLTRPISLSREQIAAFTAIFHDNHRPPQPLNDRKITLEND